MNSLQFLNNTDYFLYYNHNLLEVITNSIIPYTSQFERNDEILYYKRIIDILIEADYTFEEIYFSMAVYLSTLYEDIEEDMNIIRDIIRRELHILNNLNNFMNLIIVPILGVEQEDVKLTITQEELDKIPILDFSEIKTDEKTCSICLDEFDKESKIRKINCQHLFHSECIDKWLLENNYKCPVCRSSIAKHHANI